MPHPLPRAARLALGAVKLSMIGSIVVAGLAARPVVSSPHSGYAGYPMDDAPMRVQRLVDTHDCSVTGFGTGAQPPSAIVRTARGHLRHVSFEKGWRIYTRHGAATLVAVCLADPPGRG